MKYLLMGFDQKSEHPLAEEEIARRVRGHQRAVNELVMQRAATGDRRLAVASVGLASEDQTITIRNQDGEFVNVDGPFAEAKEVLGGFDIIDFESIREAKEFVAKKAQVKQVHVEEIRPIEEMWWIHFGGGTGEARTFMVSMLNNDRMVSSIPSEVFIKEHEGVANAYIAQRSAVESKTMSFGGVRLAKSASAITFRLNHGESYFSDGPFAETKEVFGGFQMITCETVAQAIEYGRKLCPRDGEMVEIRPVDATWWIYHA